MKIYHVLLTMGATYEATSKQEAEDLARADLASGNLFDTLEIKAEETGDETDG